MSTDTTGSDHIYSETSNDRNENLTMVPILISTEGQIINDNGVSTTTSQTDGSTFQRRSIQIQDETGKINITIWNKK
ncbi:unnamed protein product, partial [Rotaria magnacalcarata]